MSVALPAAPVRPRSPAVRLVLPLLLVVGLAVPARAGSDGDLLERGAVVARTANGERGLNASEVVTLEDGGARSRAIFKPADGSPRPTGLALQARVARKSFPRREAAASALALALGVPYVPRTIERNIDGRTGSLQIWVEDAERAGDAAAPGRQLDRQAAEMVRAFDYLIGSSDRTVRNMMVRASGSSWLPVAIDNSNSFPRAPVPRFRWPHAWVASHTGPLLPETRAFIDGIDPARVAEVLHESGIERDAAIHVLRRLARLQRDPAFLEVPSGRAASLRMQLRITRAGLSSAQGLSRSERDALDRVVIDRYGQAKGKLGVIASAGLNAGIPGTGPNLSSEAGFSWLSSPASGRRRLVLYGSGGGSILFWGRKLVSSTLRLKPTVERKVAAVGLSVARNHPIFGDRIAISPPLLSFYASRTGGLGFSIDVPPIVSVFGLPFPVARSVFSFYVSHPKLSRVSNRILDWTDRKAAQLSRKLAPVKKKLAPVTRRLAPIAARLKVRRPAAAAGPTPAEQRPARRWPTRADRARRTPGPRRQTRASRTRAPGRSAGGRSR